MDFVRQARYEEAGACMRLAERAESTGRPYLEIAWLYSHALQLLCDLGLQDEAFQRCLHALARMDTALNSANGQCRRAEADSALVGEDGGLHVQAFGILRLRRGTSELTGATWRGGKTLELLKLLVCLGDTPVAEELAIESLWPETTPESGRRDLKITLHRLRHRLEPELEPGGRSKYILLYQGFLSFHAEHVVSDVMQFDAAVRNGRRHERAGRLEAAGADYERAVTLYEGPLLSEERYQDWVTEARRERQKQLLATLKALGRWAEERHEPLEAVGWYERYLQSEPWTEGIAQRLIQLHLRLGQRSQAARVYVALREVLAAELDTRPSPATDALMQAIKA